MITKIKITRLPVRADLKLSAVLVTLDQEMHVSEESNLTVDISNRGVPYDNFGFRLGNDTGDWSPEYKATINGQVNTNTPDIPTANTNVATLGTIDLTASIVPNDSTDRIKVESVNPNYGNLIINGSKAIIGKTYMIYEFINIFFDSTAPLTSQNITTVIALLPGNKDGDGASTNINITTTGNLQGTIDIVELATVIVTGQLFSYQRNLETVLVNGSSTVTGTLTPA